MFDAIAESFKEGGWGMYPIAMVAVFIIAIGAERISYLYFKARVNKEDFVNTMHKYLFQGNLQRAITYCSSNRAPLANIIKAGLLRIDGSEAEIQSAMDEVALQEMPRIEKRTGYLAMLSNVAVLAGLLGTITGLIKAFAAVSYADAAEKAVLLAKGISEAMNCTAFGLIAAIIALMGFAAHNTKTQKLLDDINSATVQVVNLVVNNRSKINLDDLGQAA